MRVPIRYILAAIAFGVALLGFVLLPTAAHACDACQPPPPCHCEPPPSCSACSESTAHADARANAYSVNVARARTSDVIIRNRSGGGVDVSVNVGVESSFFGADAGGFAVAAESVGARLRAVCVDAAGAERMASQTSGVREIPQSFSGEVYRCASGLRMRYTFQSRVAECAASQALWYRQGRLVCLAQSRQARGYEQGLIERYGYADKIVMLAADAASADTSLAQSAAPGGVGGF